MVENVWNKFSSQSRGQEVRSDPESKLKNCLLLDSRFRGNDKHFEVTVIPAKAGIQFKILPLNYTWIEIIPFRIGFFDQFYFPGPIPFLDCFFPCNC